MIIRNMSLIVNRFQSKNTLQDIEISYRVLYVIIIYDVSVKRINYIYTCTRKFIKELVILLPKQ